MLEADDRVRRFGGLILVSEGIDFAELRPTPGMPAGPHLATTDTHIHPPAQVDCVVIGAGPAGAAFAGIVKQHAPDQSVVILERASFPRWQIGEAIVPAADEVLAELGVLDRVREAGHHAEAGLSLVHRRQPEQASASRTPTLSLLRASFDALLLDRARELGASVFEGHQVVAISPTERGHEIRWQREDGREGRIFARFVLDASGPAQLLTRGARELDETHANIAVCGYLGGVRPTDATPIVAATVDGWVWFVPVGDDMVSVGVVTTARHVGRVLERVDLERWFWSHLRRCAAITPRLRGARLRGDVLPGERKLLVRKHKPSRAHRPYGDGWAAVGDAAMALDPVLASGVARALDGGRRAAQTYLAALTADAEQRRALWQGYGRALQAEYQRERAAIDEFLASAPVQLEQLVA